MKTDAEFNKLFRTSEKLVMELNDEIKVLKALLDDAAPFARHVSACGDQKFQRIAERWLMKYDND